MNHIYVHFPIKGMRILDYGQQAGSNADEWCADEITIGIGIDRAITVRAGDVLGELVIESDSPMHPLLDDPKRLVLGRWPSVQSV